MDELKGTRYPDPPALPDHEQCWFHASRDRTNRGRRGRPIQDAGYMGFGLGELVGLRVEDLKLDHGVIEVAALSGTASKVKRRPRAGSGTSSLIPLPFESLRDLLGGRQSGRLFQ